MLFMAIRPQWEKMEGMLFERETVGVFVCGTLYQGTFIEVKQQAK